ncbi:MAG: hypothetical protein K0Q72_2479 [Armatimonadetes bacterium]|jgi:hypothetical protein|nr:hypothetical protein [Armatimonadota bacterium]
MGTFWSHFLDFFGLAGLLRAQSSAGLPASALGDAWGDGDRAAR